MLATGDRQLADAGFSARSGWLTSSTFGGISWLAHSTLQSGVWVNSPTRYDTLMASHRFTLNQAFSRAGWRTVDDVPSDNRFWSDGSSFYHYDKVYNRDTSDIAGRPTPTPRCPTSTCTSALQRLELGKRNRSPLFAEVDLVSSHEPWTQIPPLISWNAVGDGSIFYHLPVDMTGNTDVKKAYGLSIQYTMRTLFSFVQHYGRKNLVMIVLGDHQPAKIVSGQKPNHDVPISIIAHDPAVLNRSAAGAGSRHAPGAECAGLADERLPQPLPGRVRLARRARLRLVALEPGRHGVAQQHHVPDLLDVGQLCPLTGCQGKLPSRTKRGARESPTNSGATTRCSSSTRSSVRNCVCTVPPPSTISRSTPRGRGRR